MNTPKYLQVFRLFEKVFGTFFIILFLIPFPWVGPSIWVVMMIPFGILRIATAGLSTGLLATAILGILFLIISLILTIKLKEYNKGFVWIRMFFYILISTLSLYIVLNPGSVNWGD